MKTALFSLCYLEGNDLQGNSRLRRNQRYVDYYSTIKEELGFETIILADNASKPYLVDTFRSLSQGMGYSVRIIRYNEHLPRRGPLDYPYCWRGLYELKTLFDEGYEKIICIDSDGFVLSKRLANYIKSCKSGWVSFQERKYSWPEAALHILCKDALPIYEGFTSVPYSAYNGKPMETLLPFTHLERSFCIGRFGEEKMSQYDWMDFYGQANLDTNLTYRGDKALSRPLWESF